MSCFRVASAAVFLLPVLPSCSLLIDTNPDGIIENAGAGNGSTRATKSTAGTANGGALSSSNAGPSSNGGAATSSDAKVLGSAGTIGATANGGVPVAITTITWNGGGAKAPDATGGSGSGGVSIGGVTQNNEPGGTVQTGGTASGGTYATGGASATGGIVQVGGNAWTGGTPSTGGTTQAGGTSATGGAPAECVAGSVQNCTLGSFRGRQTCTAEGKLEACLPLISFGQAHGCLVTSSGNVKCWGRNDYGEVGQTPSRNTPEYAFSGLIRSPFRWDSISVPAAFDQDFGASDRVFRRIRSAFRSTRSLSAS